MISRLREMLKARALRKLFDREFYLRTNPDVAAAGVNPLRHYLRHGVAEERQPHPLFDPVHYRACCPEARDVENPLLHFLKMPHVKWPATHPLFDCQAYVSAHPEACGNPLVDYMGRDRPTGLEGSQFGQC
jgi:O-antigen biosynthesis protein